MKYFISSDIHGFYDEWIESLNKKDFDINNPNHKIILCGDLFDRGRQPKQIIDFILKNKDKFIIIRGNHEDLMQDMIIRNKNHIYDIHNGTVDTILDLEPNWLLTEFNLKKISRQTRLDEILSMCVDYFETEHYIFVHGWIPVNIDTYTYDKNWRKASKEKWNEARWINPVEMYKCKIFEPNKTIVCGHWHCSVFWHEQNPSKYDEFGKKANFEPFFTKEIISIDTCTSYSKRVNTIVIED